MLQLVLVMSSEFSLSDLALIHTKSLATTGVSIKPPEAGMNCLVEIICSHCFVIFDMEIHLLTTSTPAVCIIVSSMNYSSFYNTSQKISLRKGTKYLKHCLPKHL